MSASLRSDHDELGWHAPLRLELSGMRPRRVNRTVGLVWTRVMAKQGVVGEGSEDDGELEGKGRCEVGG